MPLGCSGFLPLSKDMQIMSAGFFKLPIGVSGCLSQWLWSRKWWGVLGSEVLGNHVQKNENRLNWHKCYLSGTMHHIKEKIKWHKKIIIIKKQNRQKCAFAPVNNADFTSVTYEFMNLIIVSHYKNKRSNWMVKKKSLVSIIVVSMLPFFYQYTMIHLYCLTATDTEESGINPVYLWPRNRVHPGQVASLYRSNTQTNNHSCLHWWAN